MSIETEIKAALSATFGDRVFPDTAPAQTLKPFCTFQQVGGVPSNSLCGNTDKQNARVQFNVWADTREQANMLMRTIEAMLTESSFGGVSQGSLIAIYDEPTRTRGARQDLSFWRTTP